MYLHVQKWTSVKLDLFRGCVARDRKSLERGNVANASSGKKYDFAKSLLDKQHEFNGTSLEVSKIYTAELFFGSSRSTESCLQEARRSKRRSLSISLSFIRLICYRVRKSRNMFESY